MNKKLKRTLICAAIAAGSVALTLSLGGIGFFKTLNNKAQDAHFLLRGKVPTRDVFLVGVDQKTLDTFPELTAFWHRYYADALRGAAMGGAKVFVLDEAFGIPVDRYFKDERPDEDLAGAFLEVNATMPVVAAFVPEAMGAQHDARFTVPINMAAATMGAAAFANLTADEDDFLRSEELIEKPEPGQPLTRSMALMAVERFLGQEAEVKGRDVYLGGKRIPTDDRAMKINFAGPPGTFPRVSLADFEAAYQRKDVAKLEGWVKGKIVLLGADNTDDRRNTPFYTFLSAGKATTAGFEIHANTIETLLKGNFLQPVSQPVLAAGLLAVAGASVAIVAAFAVSQAAAWSVLLLILVLAGTHIAFLQGWIFSTSDCVLTMAGSILGGVVYRFATAEKKSSFFRSAVALFVGREVATSLEKHEKIELTGQRRMVTILFTDIRGFTAFCESKDPAVVVDLLNVYMSKMVSIIVKYGGHVNKFIGDGILAVFSDDDPGAEPGDHALRTTRCAAEMVSEVIGEFRTGAGFHSGEVVIGNVGSSDKLEFTVLGNTVNLASRLESLNKDQKTRLLMSEESREMLKGEIDTIYLGSVPVKGKTEKMKLFTVTSLLDAERIAEIRAAEKSA